MSVTHQGSLAPSQTVRPSGPPVRFRTRMRGYRVVGATLSVLLLLLLWFGAVSTRQGQIIDTLTMDATGDHLDLGIASTRALSALVSTPILVGIGIFIALVTVVRRRLGLSLRAVFVFAAANITTQLLKDFLTRPPLGVGHQLKNSFPSGHVTVAASLMVVLIAVVPIAARSVVTYVGVVVTAFVSLAVMSLGWHRLSDVLAAIVISALFGLIALPSEWAPARPRIWTRFLAVVGFIAIIPSVVGLFLATRNLPFEPGPVSATSLSGVAASPNPGVYITVACVGLVVGSAALMAASIDRLAGGAPR